VLSLETRLHCKGQPNPNPHHEGKKEMPAFILVCSALLAFAVTIELLAFEYQPAALVTLFSSLPVSQQIAWLVICLVPLSLIAVALLQHHKLIQKDKAADVLQTRLRGIRLNLLELEQDQKDNDQAAQYLDRSDPGGAISALRARITSTEESVQYHQQRNQSGDLIGCVEQVRQQQHEIKQKLGEVIAKRRSIETSISQLQSSQNDMEQAISVIEQDKDGETLERRLQRLSQFVVTTNSRCGEVERAMPSLLELEEKFDALQRRVVPLDEKETGVNGVLKALYDVGNRLAATIVRLERDEGVSLAESTKQLANTKHALEERVSSVLAQFSEIETLHEDITGLFAKLNQAQRMPRELDGGGRVVSISGSLNSAPSAG
jgi:chromosome segregation ATPase